MHHETLATKGEFGEFTLARGRRLRSYFANRPACNIAYVSVKRALVFQVTQQMQMAYSRYRKSWILMKTLWMFVPSAINVCKVSCVILFHMLQ